MSKKVTPKVTPTGEVLPDEVLRDIRATAISHRNSWLVLGRKVLAVQRDYPWLTIKGLAEQLRAAYKDDAYLSESSLSKAATVALAFANIPESDLARRTLGFWYAAAKAFIPRLAADAVVEGLLAGALKIPKASREHRAVTLPANLVDKLHKARGKVELAKFIESLLPAFPVETPKAQAKVQAKAQAKAPNPAQVRA